MFVGIYLRLAEVLLVIYVYELCLRGIYLCDLKMFAKFTK